MEGDKIICPCCKEKRDVIEETPLLAVEAELRQRNATPWWANSEGWSIAEAKSRKLQWTCGSCLESGRAIAAQVWAQRFCDYCPYFAYFDVSFHCQDCQNTSIFFAKEQQHWYEVLKFWVQSRPNRCVTCRRRRREQVKTQQQ